MFWTVAIQRVEREREKERRENDRVQSGQQKSESSKREIKCACVHVCVREREMVDNHDMCYTLSATSMTLISCPPYHSITLLCSDLWICFFDLFFSSDFPTFM